jgi:hypothetical protein
MGNETSKCTSRRMAQGHQQKLVGRGLDIGAGDDPFRPVSGECRAWDRKNGDGDAAALCGLENDYFDYVYSSHCLEHLNDPLAALTRWVEVLKPGGLLYLAVPDYNLYEGGQKIRNRFHTAAFSLHHPTDPAIPLINLVELFAGPLQDSLQLWYLGLCDDNYDHALGPAVDQTRCGAVCHIEVMAEKIRRPPRSLQMEVTSKMRRSYSKENQDLFVLSVLGRKTGGTYLEIGAGDPVRHSNTFLLETAFAWKGVAIYNEETCAGKHSKLRKNPCFCEDATMIDIGTLLDSQGLGPIIDFLQLDIDPAHNTLTALERIDFTKYRFAVITFEHDYYRRKHGNERRISRELLAREGYRLVIGDVKNRGLSFEDWYVDETLMPDEIWKRFVGNGICMDPENVSANHREIFESILGRY